MKQEGYEKGALIFFVQSTLCNSFWGLLTFSIFFIFPSLPPVVQARSARSHFPSTLSAVADLSKLP